MNHNFLFYLVSILLVIFVFTLLAYLISKNLRRRVSGKIEHKAIRYGNVSVLFDANKNVTIIPYVKDMFGVGRATNGLQFVHYPYKVELLGNAIREAMNSCKDALPITSAQLMNSLGFSSWKEFSNGKRNISIHFMEGKGVVFNTTTRKSDGSYQFNHFGIEHSVENDIGDLQLGEVVFRLLNKCK